jgi:UDP-glucose 4-epimerase
LRPSLQVYGNDYDTPDGTGVRDYIHVMDLAEGHLAALSHLSQQTGWQAFNLGTGQGYSVLDMVKAFEQASGQSVPYQVVARRPGDVASCYAKVDKAHQTLHWQASRGLAQMCADAWRWQTQSS